MSDSDEPACGSRQAHGAEPAARELVASRTPRCCAGVPCAISRLALPLVSMRSRRWRPTGLGEEGVGRHLDHAGQLHAADVVVLRGGQHARLRRSAPARRASPAAGCTRSPSKCGSSVSLSRLNGANFSRAIRSQVSSTESKVSREWSAKRGRAVSDSTPQPVVQQEVESSARYQRAAIRRSSRQSTSNRPAAPMPPPMHMVTHDVLRAAALAFDQRMAGQARAATRRRGGPPRWRRR